MPVVAVIAAVAVDAGAIGALAAGTLGTLAAITAIGATVGAIGAVTHNKTLSIVGGALGIVGGIATLAAGSGALGNVSDLFGPSSAGAADTAGTTAADVGVTGADGVAVPTTDPGDAIAQGAASGSNAVTPTAMPGLVNSAPPSLAADEGNAAAIESGNGANAPLANALSSNAPEGVTTGEASSSVTGPTQANAFAPTADATGSLPPGFMSQYDKALNVMPDGTQLTDATSSSGSGIMNWAKNNPLLSYGIIQAGGSFISGLTNPMTPAQISALNAQAAQNNAAAALAQKQAANIGGPLPTLSMSNSPVTGTPTQASGLINSRPVASSLVTGAPNVAAPPTAPATGTYG